MTSHYIYQFEITPREPGEDRRVMLNSLTIVGSQGLSAKAIQKEITVAAFNDVEKHYLELRGGIARDRILFHFISLVKVDP